VPGTEFDDGSRDLGALEAGLIFGDGLECGSVGGWSSSID
jgi:hypothetical protein